MRDPEDAADLAMIRWQTKLSLDEAAREHFPFSVGKVNFSSGEVPTHVVSKASVLTFVPVLGNVVQMVYFSKDGRDFTIHEAELDTLPVPFHLLVQCFLRAHPPTVSPSQGAPARNGEDAIKR